MAHTPARSLQDELRQSYAFEGESILLGMPLAPDLGTIIDDPSVRIPVRSLNKHGLVAGATGTGKTKTLQVMAEQLSAKGIPVFLADLKGDLSGIAFKATRNKATRARMQELGLPWTPDASPVELLSLSGRRGTQLRVPIADFGPLLMAKIMECTDAQQSVLQIVFRWAEEQHIALLELDDFIEALKYLTSEDGRKVQSQYGGMATVTLNVLLRKAMELDTQGVGEFFGQPKFDVLDLMQTRKGRGVVTIMDLTDVQTKPKVFSTFMMWMLTELYASLPELGDPETPSLVYFFDEAHLLFDEASKALVRTVELTVRMVRSKGVSVFFVTQTPKDVPEAVLSQLGNRVQHALRAFTPRDQQALKMTASTFPISNHYDVRSALQQVGTGEALVTVLDPKGSPTPTTLTRMIAPSSTMDMVDEATLNELGEGGTLVSKYQRATTPFSQRIPGRDAQPGTTTPKALYEALGSAQQIGLSQRLVMALNRTLNRSST
jgi:uncharacterized protein